MDQFKINQKAKKQGWKIAPPPPPPQIIVRFTPVGLGGNVEFDIVMT